MLDVGFDQFVESNVKLVEKLVVVAKIPRLTKEVPNLVEVEDVVYFHDQLVVFDIELVEHLVVDDQVTEDGEDIAEYLCVDGIVDL